MSKATKVRSSATERRLVARGKLDRRVSQHQATDRFDRRKAAKK